MVGFELVAAGGGWVLNFRLQQMSWGVVVNIPIWDLTAWWSTSEESTFNAGSRFDLYWELGKTAHGAGQLSP